MSTLWDQVTKTSRRRFWLIIVPTIAIPALYFASHLFEVVVMLPGTLRQIELMD